MSDISIKVKTEKLVSVAGDVEARIRQVEQAFRNIEQTIEASRTYWQGEGASAHLKAYRKKEEIVQTALKRFRENVTDLQSIAGIYEKSEADVLANNQSLNVDMIV